MIFERIQEIIAEELDLDKDDIQPETNVKDDLHADSLDLLQVINSIEDEFGIQIDDYENINTVADVVKLVEDAE